jgi:circadian clock protein KaiB
MRDDGQRLLLFVAGDELNSRLARENIQELLATTPCDVALEIIDVLENTAQAMEHTVLVTPTLIRLAPAPRVLVIGNLSDLTTVRSALGLATEGDTADVEREQTA